MLWRLLQINSLGPVRAAIEALTDNQAFAELLLYTLRHVQHHPGQLNCILSQHTGSAPRWVKRKAG